MIKSQWRPVCPLGYWILELGISLIFENLSLLSSIQSLSQFAAGRRVRELKRSTLKLAFARRFVVISAWQMKQWGFLHRLAALLAVMWHCPNHAAAPAPQPQLLAEWNFDHANDFQGWVANGHISGPQVKGGLLTGRATGADPILELKTLLNLSASPWQIIELRLKADRDGQAQIFWSNTSQGRFGGFSGKKTTDFNVVGDGQWRTYRLFPFWHSEGKIVRLRLDLFDGAEFALDYLRVIELPARPEQRDGDFDFTQNRRDWLGTGVLALKPTRGGLAVSGAAPGDFLLSPPVQINAEERSYAHIALSATRGKEGRFYFATENSAGLHSLGFPIIADGRMRHYNVDLLPAKDWRGKIVALGLSPTDAPGGEAVVQTVAVAAEPQGPAAIKVVCFSPEDAAARAGRSLRLSALIANTGGETASNLQAKLSLPAGVKLQNPGHPAGLRSTLEPGGEMRLVWMVQSAHPVESRANLALEGAGLEAAIATTKLHIHESPALPRASYVPEPKPVRGGYEVGVYYFPGWHNASRWQPIQNFPERKPVLGWYQEGLPEVADWHIKWAVEHGITFFAYDWYWSQGARQLEHALHDGYLKARYRSLLKFCLLWANHNPPKTHSLEDSVNVVRYWITNYFQRPEYYRIDGKPVVIVFSTHNLLSDLGAEGVRQSFAAMREECRKAGLPGMYLLACVHQASQAADQGYDGITCYNWASLGLTGGEKRGPYSTLIDGYRRQWENLLATSPLPLMLPISGGWDSRPWHGEANLIRHDRTPALFRRHLQDARDLLERQAKGTNLLKAILIEAWNEWGEGSYIEPHLEYGFGYLDAVREVFGGQRGDHLDLAPVDVGLGPYDIPPPPPPRTAWEFIHDAEGWENTMHLSQLTARDGQLSGITTGNDPAFFGPAIQAPSAQFGAVHIRMRLTPPPGGDGTDTAQLFWRTKRWPENESSSLRFTVMADGQWHDYELPVRENRRWTGVITGLRLDPAARPNLKVEIDRIFLKANSAP